MVRWSAIVLLSGCTAGGSRPMGADASGSPDGESGEAEASAGTSGGSDSDGGTEDGPGSETADTSDTGGPAGTVQVDVAGHARAAHPGFRRVQNFNDDVAASADGDARRVRLRLADFTVDNDLDLSRIAAVRFDFGGELGSAHGRLALDDLELVPR